MHERIEEGFEVFASDGQKAFGAVRQIKPHGRPEIVIYVENAGDFIVPFEAVSDVHEHKVMLNVSKLAPKLQSAISHAHDAEDPNI